MVCVRTDKLRTISDHCIITDYTKSLKNDPPPPPSILLHHLGQTNSNQCIITRVLTTSNLKGNPPYQVPAQH